jgi:hypothetical protein
MTVVMDCINSCSAEVTMYIDSKESHAFVMVFVRVDSHIGYPKFRRNVF